MYHLTHEGGFYRREHSGYDTDAVGYLSKPSVTEVPLVETEEELDLVWDFIVSNKDLIEDILCTGPNPAEIEIEIEKSATSISGINTYLEGFFSRIPEELIADIIGRRTFKEHLLSYAQEEARRMDIMRTRQEKLQNGRPVFSVPF